MPKEPRACCRKLEVCCVRRLMARRFRRSHFRRNSISPRSISRSKKQGSETGYKSSSSWPLRASTRRGQSIVLQPPLENAVRHGVGRLKEGGVIAIQATIANERLHLIVTNSG